MAYISSYEYDKSKRIVFDSKKNINYNFIITNYEYYIICVNEDGIIIADSDTDYFVINDITEYTDDEYIINTTLYIQSIVLSLSNKGYIISDRGLTINDDNTWSAKLTDGTTITSDDVEIDSGGGY